MKIITFSGVDGSGKSTQLALLQKYLETNGSSVVYFHAIEWSLSQRTKRLFEGHGKRPGEAKAVTQSSGIGVLLRQLILLIDVLRFRRYFRRLERAGTDYLLSDRYFFDSIVNIAYLDGTKLNTQYAVFLTHLIPTPFRAFLLSIDPEKIMQRKRQPEQGLAYLQDKQRLFNEATAFWNLISIDAADTSNNVHHSILGKL